MRHVEVEDGQRFVMLDFHGNELDTWQVIHTVRMPTGRLRATVFNVALPADMLDIYADELTDRSRFRPVVPDCLVRRTAA
jgi:hypothetical protein